MAPARKKKGGMSKAAFTRLEKKKGMSWRLKNYIARKGGFTQKGGHWVKGGAKAKKRGKK